MIENKYPTEAKSAVDYARSYADSFNEHQRNLAFRSFMEGHMHRSEESPTDDKYQQYLSDAYSKLKVKFWDCKARMKRLDQMLKYVRDGIITEIKKEHFQ